MASVKVVLRKKKNKEGNFPLVIRITHNRKASFVYTGQYISEQHWDELNQKVKKSHPNSTRLNNYLVKKVAEANNKLIELATENKIVSAKTVQKKIKNQDSPTSFCELSSQYLQNLEQSGKYSTLKSDKSRIDNFKNFLKTDDIYFQDITEMLIKKFQAYLKSKLNNSDRSIVNHLIVLRSLYNLAIREGIVDSKYYPFGKGKINVKIPQSIKIGLNKEELLTLEALELPIHSPIWNARNVWLVSFYFAGMRVSDVLRLKWSDFQDNRLHYSMGKNKKVGTLKIPEKVANILNFYLKDKQSDTDFIFAELKQANLKDLEDVNRKIGTAVKKFNKYMKQISEKAKINKKITMHIARHTFGNISGDKIPIQMLQRLYRHSSVTTTIGYQSNFIYKDTDDALDSVIN